MRAPIHEIIVGDVFEKLRDFPDRSIQCIITSPPFFNLRSYLKNDDLNKSREIGIESTPDAYVARLVEVFREARRCLRDDGVMFLNLGDSYAANRSYQVPSTKGGSKHSPAQGRSGTTSALNDEADVRGMRVPDGLKPKDLIGIPWRVAFALQADGWYLRLCPPRVL